MAKSNADLSELTYASVPLQSVVSVENVGSVKVSCFTEVGVRYFREI